MMLTFDNHQSR